MGLEAYLRVGVDGTAATSGARVVNMAMNSMSDSAGRTVSQIDRIKGAFDRMGFSIGAIKNIMAGMVSGMAMWEGLKKGIEAIVDVFKSAFLAVDDFKSHVAMAAATVMSFMEKGKDESLADQWKRANTYAKEIIPTIELISAQMIMTGRQATLMFVELTKGNVFLNASNKEAVKGFQALGNAVSILTSGQDPERQIMTELRALVTGIAQPGAMLLRMLEAMDPLLKSHSAEWKKSGTYLQHMAELLSGFTEATSTLAGLWKAVSTTISTVVTQIIRGGMEQVYANIMFYVAGIRDYLMSHRDILAGAFQKALLTISGLFETIWTLVTPLGPTLKYVLGFINLIANGLGILAYVILPVVAKVIVGIWNSLDHIVSLAWTFGLTMLDGIGAAAEAVGSLGKAIFQAITGNLDDAKKTLQDMFKGDYATRFIDNAHKLGASVKSVMGDVKALWSSGYTIGDMVFSRYQQYTAPSKLMNPAHGETPKPGPGDTEQDKALKAELKLNEAKMKAALEYTKKVEELSRNFYDHEFETGEISYNKMYTKRYESFVREQDRELDIINKQIGEAEKAKSKVKPGTDTAKKDTDEIETKLVEYRSKADQVRLDTARKLQGLNQQNIKDLQKEFDLLHRNRDAYDKMTMVQIQVTEDPYAQQMEAIKQRYQTEIEWQQKLVDSTMEGTVAREKAEERLALLEESYAEETYIFKRQMWRDAAASAADSMTKLSTVMMTGSEEQFEAGKKMAVASALTSTYLGAQQAFTSLSGIPYVGVALGIAAAAAAVASGLQRVEEIRKQHYVAKASGGLIDKSLGIPHQDSVLALLTPGEMVIKEKSVESIGADKLLYANNTGRLPRFADGGVVGGYSGNVTSITEYKMAKDQKAQLDATVTLVEVVKENTAAVTRVADGLTKIDGMLDNFKGNFINLASSILAGSAVPGDTFMDKMKTWTDDKVGVGHGGSGGKDIIKFVQAIDFLKGIQFGNSVTNWIMGGKQSISGQGISLGYGGGEVQGNTYTEIHTKGGLLSHGHNSISLSALPSEFQQMIQDNSDLLKSAIINAAAAMGQGAEGINAAELAMRQINLKDLSPEDQAKAVEGWFQQLANAFSSGVAGLDALQKPGEDSFSALIRLSTALQAVNNNAQQFGGTMLSLSLASADAASKLVDSMGGMDEYITKTSAYFEMFYSSGEQARIKAEIGAKAAGDAFKTLGMIMPSTAEGFRSIVNSLDLTTDAGRKAYSAIMGIASAADALYKLNKEKIATQTDITSRALSLSGDTVGATLFELRLKQATEYADAVDKYGQAFVDSSGLAAVQAQEFANALKSAATSIKNTVLQLQLSLLGVMKNIMNNNGLSPESSYFQARSAFITASLPGNEAQLGDAASTFVAASEAYNASGPAFQADLQMVLDKLGEVAGIGAGATIDTVMTQISLLQRIADATAQTAENTMTKADYDVSVAAQTYGKAYDKFESTLTSAQLAYTSGATTLEQYNNTVAPALAAVESAQATATGAGVTSFVDISGVTRNIGTPTTLEAEAAAPIRYKSTQWAQAGIDLINNPPMVGNPAFNSAYDMDHDGVYTQSDLASISHLLQSVRMSPEQQAYYTTAYSYVQSRLGTVATMPGTVPFDAQYDINKDKALNGADATLLQAMIADPSKLPTYAMGSSFLPSDQTLRAHFGEAVIDRESNKVLQKYGIRVQVAQAQSKDNKGLEERLDKLIAANIAMEQRLASIEKKARLVSVAGKAAVA